MSKLHILLPGLFLGLALISRGLADPAESTPLPALSLEQVRSIIDAASGDRALRHIQQLTLQHRWFVSDGYLAAASYVRDQVAAIGLQDVRMERFPSDGEIFYSTDKSLPKWTVRSASLRMVAPDSRHLVSWAENPIVLASNSRSADIEAELVDVGEGVQASDYQGKEVRGKLVLASAPQVRGRIEAVHRLAVLERGAAGVISYRSYHLDDFPDLVTWDHIWTLELDGRRSTFGFCISKRMGWELKRLLQEGRKVILRARVDAELSAGDYGVVTGHIPGTDPAGQEVWFVAHLDHSQPSANDNASGSAAILETARVFKTLLDSKEFPRPRRTIRFLWVPEIRGSSAYISRHLDQTRRAVAVINMDMVGENQELCSSVFQVTRTPDSTPSFLNELLQWNLDFMQAHEVRAGSGLTDPMASVSPFGSQAPWKAAVIPYSAGSDHDVFMGGVINIPATMLGSWPDNFYHSSGDTPDKCDPTQLKRAIVYGTMLAASIADLDAAAAQSLLQRMQAAAMIRLFEERDQARRILEGSKLTGGDFREALGKIRWAVRREVQAIASIGPLVKDDPAFAARSEEATVELTRQLPALEESIRGFYRQLCEIRGQKTQPIPSLTVGEEQAQSLIPMRNPEFPGILSTEYIAMKLQALGRKFDDPFRGIERYELDAFIDGKLNILELRDAVSAECGPIRISDVLSYMRALADSGLISFRNK